MHHLKNFVLIYQIILMKMLGSILEKEIDPYITGTWQRTHPLSFTGGLLTEKNYSKWHVIREGCRA